jgi:hypothetical protein
VGIIMWTETDDTLKLSFAMVSCSVSDFDLWSLVASCVEVCCNVWAYIAVTTFRVNEKEGGCDPIPGSYVENKRGCVDWLLIEQHISIKTELGAIQ